MSVHEGNMPGRPWCALAAHCERVIARQTHLCEHKECAGESASPSYGPTSEMEAVAFMLRKGL